MSIIWNPTLDADAQRWQGVARETTASHFAPLATQLDTTAEYPWESVKVLTDTGLAGMFVPKEYGGGGASLTALCATLEEVAYGCAATCGILAVYLLGTMPLQLAGTPEQKERYLRPLASEGKGISFGLTERSAGSDAAAITTTALPEGGGFRIRGEKWFIGNGGASETFIIFAKTDPEAGGRGITAFVVDAKAEGVVVDVYLDKMGIRGTQTTNIKLDTWVPNDAMLGERGRGLSLALATLAVGRITLAGQALGIARAAYDASAQRSVERFTFGRPIIDNQGISFKLADMVTDITAGRILMYEAARAWDAEEDTAVLGQIAKLYTSEASKRVVDAAVQIFGGDGFVRPTLVERLYRDQRATEIYEGTSEVIRMVIGREIKREWSTS